MNEIIISKSLKKDNIISKINNGVYAFDEKPMLISYPSAFVINTKPREHPGEHWLAIYYDKHGHAFFFDSYGEHPAKYKLEDYLTNTSTSWVYNKKRIQG